MGKNIQILVQKRQDCISFNKLVFQEKKEKEKINCRSSCTPTTKFKFKSCFLTNKIAPKKNNNTK